MTLYAGDDHDNCIDLLVSKVSAELQEIIDNVVSLFVEVILICIP
jgi:hypothetical protein